MKSIFTSGRRNASLAILTGNSLNTLILSIQAIVLVPLYLQAIGPKLYGAWLGSGDILIWIQILDLGIPSLIIQRIGAAHGSDDIKSVGEYFAASLFILTGVATILAVLAVGFAMILPSLMGIDGADALTLRNCFIIGGLAAAIIVANNSVIALSRGIQDTKFLNIILVAGSLAGFVVTLWLILAGWKLWSIALGIAVRTLISVLGSIVYVIKHLKGPLGGFIKLRKNLVREIIKISPITTIGGLGYALMSQSESALVAILICPEMAVVMTLTRRAVDFARSLVDSVGMAVYGGYAHLVNSPERIKALQVHSEIHMIRLSMAISLASAFMAVNASLVSVWVGPAQYGGSLLTILIAIQFIITGSSYLMNYLFRATGPVVKGSIMLFVECLIRLPLMIILLSWIGLPGLPIAAILTAVPFGWLSFRLTVRQLCPLGKKYPQQSIKTWIGGIVSLLIGVLIGLFIRHPSWIFVIIMGTSIAIGSFAVFILFNSRMRQIKQALGFVNIGNYQNNRV